MFDFKMPGMDTPEGQGLLAAAFSLLQARKMPGDRGIGGALGAAGERYMGVRGQAQDQMQKRKYQDLQMTAQQRQLEQQAAADRQRQADEAAVRGSLVGGNFDPRQFLQSNPTASLGALEQGMKFNSALNPAPKFETVAAGSSLYRMGPNGPELAMTAPTAPKEKSLPAAVQEYEYAVGQGYKGNFDQWNKDTKKAGATQIGMPKIDIKMGESVAGQIGPMAKDSRVMAQGAVKMFDAADRIDAALQSGMVSAGPGTTQIQTVKQLIQKVSGGNDEGIRQTRQVIKSLAQMAVEARKQLAGQGQVTESEAAAVAKADAGDINDLTTGELKDLVTLTRRAAHFSAKSHQEMLDSMAANDGTRSGVPFYKVQGMDRLLQYQPTLPQIGGGNRSAVDDVLKLYPPRK